MNGDRIRAERHARELVADMHWRGMPDPALYTHMAAEFHDLVASGDYAAWVATGGRDGSSRGRPASLPGARYRLAGPTSGRSSWRRRGAGPVGGR